MSKLSQQLILGSNVILFIIFVSITSISLAQPLANFSADVTKVCSPVVVQFKDLSIGSPTKWKWDFGNGNTSTDKNPGAFYISPGAYTVTLIVSDVNDKKDTLKKPYYISAYATPVSAFTASDTIACIPLSVNFADQSVPQSGAITNWFWNFGDGAYSTLPNPSHTYSTSGNYNVSLLIKDVNGCQRFLVKDKYIQTHETKASFATAGNIFCPDTAKIDFINTSKGSGLSYSWTFGDGYTSADMNPSHAYTKVDSFQVKLVVTDGVCSDSSTQQLKTMNLKADFDYKVSCSTAKKNPNFTISCTDKSNPATSSWYWDFGDGQTSTKKNPVHTYSKVQPYTITLIAKINNGCNNTVRKTYTPPVAAFSTTSFYCQSPVQATFTNQSAGTDSVSYLWDFDDGSTSTLKNPVHTYIVPKTVLIDSFFVNLKVTDKFGCLSSIEKPIAVRKPQAKFSTDVISGCIPLKVTFTDKSSSTDAITQWKWDFGDAATSTLKNPIHTYTDTGHYTVKLIVTTTQGCKDTLIQTNYIKSGIKPDFIDFTSYDSTCFHNVYPFKDLSKYNDVTVKANNWKWYFGYRFSMQKCLGDSFINVKDPEFDTGHLPIGVGVDTILFMAGYNECYDTTSKTLINVPPQTRMVYFNQDSSLATNDKMFSCSAPVTMGFSNWSKKFTSVMLFFMEDLQTGKITNLDTASSAINFITFNKAGKYQFTLKTHNDTTKLGGCSDINPHYMLSIDSVVNGFSVTPKSVCRKGNTFSFQDTSKSIYGEIKQWFWDFGDGEILKNDTIEEVIYYDTVKTILKGSDKVHPLDNHSGRTAGTYQKPTHTYKDTGTYIVKSVVTSNVFYWCCGNGGFYNGVDIWDTSNCTYIAFDTVRVHDVFANFKASDTLGCIGKITFTDSSKNNIIYRKWDFGDGTAEDSITKNPVHTYSDSGSFTVSLIVKDNVGCIDTNTKENHIRITSPVADFVDTSLSTCLGSTTYFTNKSSGDSIRYLWKFGDNTTDSIRNPIHTYNALGTYNIILTVTDKNGCSNTKSQTNYSVNSVPTAGFKADTLLIQCPPAPIVFSDTSSATAVKWFWDFGDGLTSTLKSPSHYYTTSGKFNLSLTVTDSKKCSNTIVKNNYITVKGPEGNLSFISDTACAPRKVDFLTNAANVSMYYWDFGDGSLAFLSSQNRGDSVEHNYSIPGIYTPNLILHDSLNCIYTVPSTKKVYAEGARIKFSYGNDSIHCDLDSIFFGNETYSVLPISHYDWDFGDGMTSTKISPTHYFKSSGKYPVSLTTTSTLGCVSKYTQMIYINKAPTIVLDIDGKKCIPLQLKFTARNTDTLVSVKSWTWNIENILINQDTVTQKFMLEGNHNITLYCIYGDGACTKDSTIMVNVFDSLKGDFSYSPPNPSVNNPKVSFANLSNNITSSFWYFTTDEDDTSSLQNPTYTYLQQGRFPVKLIVSHGYGCADTIIKSVFVASQAYIKVPTGFTPDGNGINDKLTLHQSGIESLTTFKIFNRWGELMFETTNITDGWDGNYNGAPQNSDTYSYYVVAKVVGSTEPLVQKGTFTLIR